jgi:hypothetical protein
VPVTLQIIAVSLTFTGIILIPMFAFVLRRTVRWAKIEDQLQELGKDIATLVKDKDRVHQAMIEQMGEDRKATNVRLRWLEENVWRRDRAS